MKNREIEDPHQWLMNFFFAELLYYTSHHRQFLSMWNLCAKVPPNMAWLIEAGGWGDCMSETSRQKKDHDLHTCTHEFFLGQWVLVCNLRAGPHWLQGTVIEQKGPLSLPNTLGLWRCLEETRWSHSGVCGQSTRGTCRSWTCHPQIRTTLALLTNTPVEVPHTTPSKVSEVAPVIAAGMNITPWSM